VSWARSSLASAAAAALACVMGLPDSCVLAIMASGSGPSGGGAENNSVDEFLSCLSSIANNGDSAAVEKERIGCTFFISSLSRRRASLIISLRL